MTRPSQGHLATISHLNCMGFNPLCQINPPPQRTEVRLVGRTASPIDFALRLEGGSATFNADIVREVS